MTLLPTEKFLWDIYHAFEKTDTIASFILKPRVAKLFDGMQNPIFEKYRKEKGRRVFNKLIYYAKSRGYITTDGLRGNRTIMLTKKGLDKVFKASFKIEKKTKRKDGKWIMLAFDIPQKYKKSRNLLNSILHNLGYKMFQQSVWITPYDVNDKTEAALQFYSLEKFVKIFLIEEI